MAEWDVVSSEPLTAAPKPVTTPAKADQWAVVSHEPIPMEGGPVPSTGIPKGFYAVTGDDGKQTLRRELGFGDFVKSLSDLPGVGLAERFGQGTTRLAGKAASGIASIFGADPAKIQGTVNKATELPASNDPLARGAEMFGEGTQNFLNETGLQKAHDTGMAALPDAWRTGIQGAEEAAPDIAALVGLRGLGGAPAAAAEEASTFRNADAHPIARDIAGGSGKDALTIHNQTVGDAVAGSEAGVAQSAELNYPNIKAARTAPSSVYDRLATSVPDGPLNDNAQNGILQAGQPEGGRVSQGSPVAQQQIETLRQQLLSPTNRKGGQWTGQNWVNEWRGLRQEGYGNIASDDVSNQQLGKAQLDMSKAIQGHLGDSLPADAPVSMDQFKQATTALAKNHAVEAALRGQHVDLQAIARMQRADPDLLTGGLKHIADFANDNPKITSLASNVYSPPSYTKDVMGVPGTSKVEHFLSPSFWTGIGGGQALARRILTGSTPDAVRAAQSQFPGRGTGQFGPLEPAPASPGSLNFNKPESQGLSIQPYAPSPAAMQRPGGPSLADVLSEGLESQPVPELTAGPMGAPAPQGLPFRANAEHMAGDLSLADEFTPGAAANNRDVAGVMSQGVPDGTTARTQPGGHQVAHEADELGNHTFTTTNGETHATENGPYLQIKRSDVAKPARGTGEGMAMLERAAQAAEERDLQLASDVSVSPDAQHQWAGMKRRGYTVTKNPSSVSPSTGNLVSKDPRKPVFVVSPRTIPLAQSLGGAGG